MPTIAPIAEPGVTVIQEFTASSPATSSAVLPAAIVGPAFEIIDILDSDGVLNADALAGIYDQFPQSILQSAFPDPRSNNAELNIQEETISAWYYYGNLLTQLDRGDGAPRGSAFLSNTNPVRRAAYESIIDENHANWTNPTTGVLVGSSFVLAFDIASEADVSQDVTVTIAGAAGVATAAELVSSINTAVGDTVAALTGSALPFGVRIFSPTWGAQGNVNLRADNTVLIALFGSDEARRCEGAGFRAQDDADGDLQSPWIEFFEGESYLDGVADLFVDPPAGLVQDDTASTFTGAAVAPVTFTGATADIPLQAATAIRAGDMMYGDGSQVQSGEIIEVQNARFRLGTLNSALSTFDSDGNATNRVYTDVEVNTMGHGTPFAPRYAWFQAQGLQFGVITPTPVAAVLVGANAGLPAQSAEIQGTISTPAGALVLTNLTLILTYIKDGVTQPQLTLTFTSDPVIGALGAAITAMLTAAGVSADFAVTVYNDGTNSHVHIATTALGDDQSLTLLSTGTANDTLGFSDSANTAHTGKDVEFASRATETGATITLPIALLNGTDVTVAVTDSRGSFTKVHTMGADEAADATLDDLATELNLQAHQLAWDGNIRIGTFSGPSAASGELVFTSYEGGAAVTVAVSDDSGGGGTLDMTNPPVAGTSDIAGEHLQWQLDSGAQTFEVTFPSDSLEDVVEAINFLHGGNIVASINTGDQLQLTSPLLGAASRVQVTQIGVYNTAADHLGLLTAGINNGDTDDTLLSSPSMAGAGRPNPDFYVDQAGAVQIGGQILRSTLTGVPFGATAASLYLDFHALRLDVSSSSLAAEKLLTLDDQDDLEAVLSPLTLENPLGLGMYFALLNSPTTPVHGIGVDEVSAALPTGTVDGYARAVDELEAKDVYGIVPLSAEALVHQLLATHVTAMSVPAQRGERVCFINPPTPTRAFPTTVATGDSNSTSSNNELVLDQNPSAGLVAESLNPAALSVADGVYLEITIGGVFRRYSVSVVSANLAQFRVAFTGMENADGFYTTSTLSESVVDGDYALKVRGDALLIPGSTRTDLTATANAIANAANAYANRRVFYVFPDSLTATLEAGTALVPGYYACAAIAGMIGQMNPSAPFSRVPITGFTAVQGSQDTFKPSLLDQIAGGGVYILTQQGDGAPVSSRHQLSTDVSTIERRELSITKAVDFVAKYLRNILRNFIGRNNITPQFLDTLSSVVQAQLAFLGIEGLGVIADGTLNNLVQDEAQPDTILVDVQLTVLYPANYIRVTIRV